MTKTEGQSDPTSPSGYQYLEWIRRRFLVQLYRRDLGFSARIVVGQFLLGNKVEFIKREILSQLSVWRWEQRSKGKDSQEENGNGITFESVHLVPWYAHFTISAFLSTVGISASYGHLGQSQKTSTRSWEPVHGKVKKHARDWSSTLKLKRYIAIESALRQGVRGRIAGKRIRNLHAFSVLIIVKLFQYTCDSLSFSTWTWTNILDLSKNMSKK